MGNFIIQGGHSLSGEITPQGAKNEALQVVCATLLTDQPVVIHNVPQIVDVLKLMEILSSIGVEISQPEPGTPAGGFGRQASRRADRQRRDP